MPKPNKRKIAIITGTRAEYGILKPLLHKIKRSKRLELRLLVTGMHLLREYGLTLNDIKRDGFKIEVKVPMYSSGEIDATYYGKALARGINGFTLALNKIRPDILLVFGDRLEPLAATLAAATLNIVIAHIHGGDSSPSGHIDEAIRHSISKFAHLHLTPTKLTERRLIKMGEEAFRIFRLGALNLDSLLSQPLLNKKTLFNQLNLDMKQELIIMLFHPMPQAVSRTTQETREIVEALRELRIQTVIIYPNNDTGSQEIIKEINKAKSLPGVKIFPNIRHQAYLSLLKHASVLIGNSSSGLLEAPTMKLPTVNIGERQIGREHGANIIFVKARKKTIVEAIKRALYDQSFINQAKRSPTPWGNGEVSAKIVKILTEIKLDERLLKKRITY